MDKENEFKQDLNVFGMEKQGLHNSALVIVYRDEFPNETKDLALRYLNNLLIQSINELAKDIQSKLPNIKADIQVFNHGGNN